MSYESEMLAREDFLRRMLDKVRERITRHPVSTMRATHMAPCKTCPAMVAVVSQRYVSKSAESCYTCNIIAYYEEKPEGGYTSRKKSSNSTKK